MYIFRGVGFAAVAAAEVFLLRCWLAGWLAGYARAFSLALFVPQKPPHTCYSLFIPLYSHIYTQGDPKARCVSIEGGNLKPAAALVARGYRREREQRTCIPTYVRARPFLEPPRFFWISKVSLIRRKTRIRRREEGKVEGRKEARVFDAMGC